MRKIYQAVSQILSDILGTSPDLISPETKIQRFTYQEKAAAAIACEKTFHVELEDERIDGLLTVSDWVTYIQERLSNRDDAYAPPTDSDREAWIYQRKKG